LRNAAVSESAYLQSLLEPVLPLIVHHDHDPHVAETARAVDLVLKPKPLGSNFLSMAIWLPDNTIVYSTDKALLGVKFPRVVELQAALQGRVSTALWDRQLLGLYFREIMTGAVRVVYAPLRDPATGKVIAVAEIAADAEPLRTQLDAIKQRTWIVVGISLLLMLAVLFAIVHLGSRTIDEQQRELERRFRDQKRLLGINEDLNARLQDSNRRGIELGEKVLDRIGSNLQAGPAQLLALALLRMHELRPGAGGDASAPSPSFRRALDVVERATSGALKEVREIAAGLILPDLRELSPVETVQTAIRMHEHATGARVVRNIGDMPDHLPEPVTICIFRFVQEGLAYTWRRTRQGQHVMASTDEAWVTVTIGDLGPEVFDPQSSEGSDQLGLRGLHQRVESIGGSLEIVSAGNEGGRLLVRLPSRA